MFLCSGSPDMQRGRSAITDSTNSNNIKSIVQNSAIRTRARSVQVRTEYPSQLDYSGIADEVKAFIEQAHRESEEGKRQQLAAP